MNKATNILQTIIAYKEIEVAQDKLQLPLSAFLADVIPTERNFLKALTQPGARFILECKKASPSKGLIRANFHLPDIASVYGKYADCISVLTDQKFFQGSYDYLRQMRALVNQPLLHKDFIIDPYQIYRGRLCGADAVLLMLSVLDDERYVELAAIAKRLNMTVLTEVSNEAETKRAVALDAELIGINNRNLRTLETDLNTTFQLAHWIPKHIPIVSESGIYRNSQVRQLGKVATAFLVGSSLMAQDDLQHAVHALTRGEHKVCGLTSAEQAAMVASHGALFGGLIFYPKSPRAVTPGQAEQICASQALKFVGVFVNESVEQVVQLAKHLQLYAVQLHGDEDEPYLLQLRAKLAAKIQIWRAYRIADDLPPFSDHADRIVLDTYVPGLPGGTGTTFNWDLLSQRILTKPVMLSGGLQSDNLVAALKTAASGLDMNSGLESAPGIKDAAKVASAFQKIREFSYDTAQA